ncbi:MAG: putative DNA-binding protein [Myoviridae sp. ctThM1]|nr:MAG: putative DNA-binding protein [Myoviridae sp. ctThM1]
MGLLYGVGNSQVDICGPTSRKIGDKWVMYPEYLMWKGVLNRACSEGEKLRRPSCKESLCNPAWYLRKNFQDWYFAQEHYYDSNGEILQIDKDIIFINNKTYGPETSALVPRYVNIVTRKMSKGVMPWVAYQRKGPRMINEFKNPWRFEVFHEGQSIRGSRYHTPLDAHLAACEVKIECLHQTIGRYEKDISFQQKVCDGLTNRIELLRKCIDKKRVCSFY